MGTVGKTVEEIRWDMEVAIRSARRLWNDFPVTPDPLERHVYERVASHLDAAISELSLLSPSVRKQLLEGNKGG